MHTSLVKLIPIQPSEPPSPSHATNPPVPHAAKPNPPKISYTLTPTIFPTYSRPSRCVCQARAKRPRRGSYSVRHVCMSIPVWRMQQQNKRGLGGETVACERAPVVAVDGWSGCVQPNLPKSWI